MTVLLIGKNKVITSHHNDDRRPNILCSICLHSFGALAKDLRLYIDSFHNQPMYLKMCSIDISVNLQLVGLNFRPPPPPTPDLGG